MPTGGQFAATTRAESLITLDQQSTPPEVVCAIVRDAVEYATEIEFPNHGEMPERPAAENPVDDWDEHWLTLDYTADPRLARNNCDAASSAVLADIAQPSVAGTTAEADLIDIRWHHEAEEPTAAAINVSIHVAVVVRDPGEPAWVVDFTARQFDPGLPWPYIATEDEWRAEIDRIAREHFSPAPRTHRS